MNLPADPFWLGAFKGAEHTFLDCEVLGLEHVEPAQLERMWEAQGTIWFDYARLHPVKALYWFCHCYGRAYGAYLYTNIDESREFSKGIKGDPMVHRELRNLIAVKTQADEAGVPYEIWISAIFDWFSRQGWTRPPRPSHMASSVEAQEHAKLAWAERVTEQIVYPKDPWFAPEAFVGHPQQLRCEQHIIESIRMRPNRDIALGSALYEVGMVRVERAAQVFPGYVLDAQRWVERQA